MRLLFIVFLLLPNLAWADKVVCDDPVDNVARMGIPAALNYSLTEDDENKECRFSIEGVAAGSPPEEELMAAADLLRDPEVFRQLVEREPQVLLANVALLLAAASPFETPDFDLLTEENAAMLQRCSAAAIERAIGNVQTSFDSKLACGVFSQDNIGQFNDEITQGGVRLESLDFVRMIVANRRSDGLTEYLFLRAF